MRPGFGPVAVMTHWLRVVLGILGIALLVLVYLWPEPSSEGTVVRVADGDTATVLTNGAETKYRIIGIDTPETRKPGTPVQCGGPEASRFAKAFLMGKRVTVVLDPSQGTDGGFGRSLAYLEVDGRDYGLAALEAGLAREYTYDKPYQRQGTYRRAQKGAERSNIGMWKECR